MLRVIPGILFFRAPTVKGPEMDRQFLEFFGNFLLNAAKGQRQMEEMTRWMGHGVSGVDKLTDAFRTWCGLEGSAPDSPDYAKARERASRHFRESLDQWLELMNLIPASDHLALKKKYESLEKEVAEKDQTIRRLRTLLNETGIPHAEAVRGFADLMEKQTAEFQDLMENMGKAFNPAPKDK